MLLRQAWRTVSFVHWRYDRAVLAALLPDGLTVDEADGSGWVSLTPLRMQDVRPVGLPALPYLSAFPETNLRTYVRGPDGGQGVWFFSLDAARAWITFGARLLLGAPYRLARLSVSRADVVRYAGRRLGSAARYRLAVAPGEAVAEDRLDRWLTDRVRAYTRHAGTLLEVPVSHEPWPLRRAEVASLEQTLTDAAGLPRPGRPALVHYSDGVRDVGFAAARAVPPPPDR